MIFCCWNGISYPQTHVYLENAPCFWCVCLCLCLCLCPSPKSKEANRALELFEEMKRGPPEALTAPNQYTYNAIIGVLTFSGRLEQATEKFREMQEVKGVPFTPTASALR